MSFRIAVPDLDRLVQRYREGASVAELARGAGVSRGVMRQRVAEEMRDIGCLRVLGILVERELDLFEIQQALGEERIDVADSVEMLKATGRVRGQWETMEGPLGMRREVLSVTEAGRKSWEEQR